MVKIDIKAKALTSTVTDTVPSQEYAKASESLQLGFNELLQRISKARSDIKNIRSLVNDALKLALKDYTLHNNKNSLQRLVTTPVDNTAKSGKIYLYYLYNVKDYISSIGLKLEYTAKDGFSIYFKEGFTLEAIKTCKSYLEWLQEYKAEKALAKPVKSKYEIAKELLKSLPVDDLQKLKAVFKL